MMRPNILFLALLVSVFSNFSHAIDEQPLSTTTLNERYQNLTHLLRCVTCQNQTIASSNAPVAANMRQLVREQLEAGATDEQITSGLREKFGDYVLYEPPFNWSNALLWLLPILVLLAGLYIALQALRNRSTGAPTDVAIDQMSDLREKARALLAGKL